MIAVLALVLVATTTMVVADPYNDDPLDVKEYLHTFGYLPENDESGAIVEVRDALLQFQRQNGLMETGEADQETETLMKTPRCSMSDADALKSDSLTELVFNTKLDTHLWSKPQLTYHFRTINEYTKNMVRSAFAFWERETQFRFSEVGNFEQADIVVSVEKPIHKATLRPGVVRDCDEFSRTTLAHALYPTPNIKSYAHFNVRANWDRNDFWSTAVHELGHILGLKHIQDKSAIMYPYSINVPKVTQLPPADRKYIESLYPVYGRKNPVFIANRGPSNAEFQVSATTTRDGKLYVFANNVMWSSDDPRPRLVSFGSFVPESGISDAFTFYDNEFLIATANQLILLDSKNNLRFSKKYRDMGMLDNVPVKIASLVLDESNDPTVHLVQGNRIYKFDRRRHDLSYVQTFEINNSPNLESVEPGIYDLSPNSASAMTMSIIKLIVVLLVVMVF